MSTVRNDRFGRVRTQAEQWGWSLWRRDGGGYLVKRQGGRGDLEFTTLREVEAYLDTLED